MKEALRYLWLELKSDEDGVTTVEYAVMLFLVAIAILAFGQGIANSVTGVFQDLINNMT